MAERSLRRFRLAAPADAFRWRRGVVRPRPASTHQRSSGAPSPLVRLAAVPEDVVAVVGLIVLSLALFGPHVLGLSTFIGDTDRLEIFLSMRKLEVDAWQTMGRVPAWSDFMPLGIPTYGLHWLFLGLDPISAVMALFPTERLLRVAGYVTAAHVAAGAIAAYLAIRDVVPSPFSAAVGAALYVCSGFLAQGITQIDSIFAVLIFQPIGLLILRRLRPGRVVPCFLGLSAVVFALVGFTFIQEAAYILIFLGMYACYRGLTTRDWRPVVVLGAAGIVGILLAMPRVGTVFEVLQEVSRTTSIQTTCPCEVLRWFDDGIFGRDMGEAYSLGNSINLHEGLQLYTSTFAAAGVLTMLLRPRGGPALLAGVGFLLMLVLLAKWMVGTNPVMVGLLIVTGGLSVWAATRPAIGRRLGMQDSFLIRDPDVRFFELFALFAFAVVLTDGMRYLFYLAFFRVDFTHARFSITALLPICMLAAIFVHELFGDPRGSGMSSRRQQLQALAVARVTAVVVVLSLDRLASVAAAALFGPVEQIRLANDYVVLTHEIGRVVATGAVFIVVLWANWLARHVRLTRPIHAIRLRRSGAGDPQPRPLGRLLPAYILGCLMVAQAFANVYVQLNGEQTQTYPVPFVGNNSFTAPADVLRSPSATARQAIRERLEVDAYRSIVVSAPDGYPSYGTPSELGHASFIAPFWGLRLVNGYPLLNRRLAALPWPPVSLTLRSVSFPDQRAIPWPLLSVLNVKYAVVASPSLLFNVPATPRSAGRGASPGDLTILENPLPVVPRAFFAATIVPGAPIGTGPRRPVTSDELGGILPADPTRESMVEGLPASRSFETTAASIQAAYQGDRVQIQVEPAQTERFLVVNELYHPGWHAYADGREITVWPTNVVMRGVLVPPGATRIEMRFEPFFRSGLA